MRIGGPCLIAIAVAAILPFSRQGEAAAICGVRFESPGQIELFLKRQRGLKRTINADQYYGYAEKGGLKFWLFTKPGNPAHPSVSCRRAVQIDGSWRMHANIMCRQGKRKCGAIAAQFKQLDRQMKKDIEDRVGRQ
ncbi:MAG: hypothetical protein M3N38_06245 [Pseudomonadota bacterium]|nr:hypothetical protein [Pseudomonadota bacterium]